MQDLTPVLCWLNLHRPCLFASELTNDKGKIIKRYRHEDVKTPLECLVLLDKRGLLKLKEGITLAALQDQANEQTDLAAAQAMRQAKAELFARFNTPKPKAVRQA